MAKIGQFIYPWGNGHYSRMMRLNEKLKQLGDNEFPVSYTHLRAHET